MPGNALKRAKKISRKKSEQMLLDLANFSNNYRFFNMKFHSVSDLKRFCRSKGIDFNRIAEEARNTKNAVPFFENLVGSVWTGTGIKVSKFNPETNEQETILDGDGQYSEAKYWTWFEASVKSLDRAIDEASFLDFCIAIERGVASIEAYIAHRAAIWNGNNPDAKLIDEHEKKSLLKKK